MVLDDFIPADRSAANLATAYRAAQSRADGLRRSLEGLTEARATALLGAPDKEIDRLEALLRKAVRELDRADAIAGELDRMLDEATAGEVNVRVDRRHTAGDRDTVIAQHRSDLLAQAEKSATGQAVTPSEFAGLVDRRIRAAAAVDAALSVLNNDLTEFVAAGRELLAVGRVGPVDLDPPSVTIIAPGMIGALMHLAPALAECLPLGHVFLSDVRPLADAERAIWPRLLDHVTSKEGLSHG